MGTRGFKLNKVPFLLENKKNINVSRAAAPKPALVPANRYDCYIK